MLKLIRDFFDVLVNGDKKDPMYNFRHYPQRIQDEILAAMEAQNLTDIR